MYKGETVFLADIMRIDRRVMPAWMHPYDGYTNDSFFSGLLVKYTEIPDSYGDYGVTAYTFIA